MGGWASQCILRWYQAGSARYAQAVPMMAPPRASAPAVAAVSARRVLRRAPAAVSVRRSRAVSLRISPTVMASTPRAIVMPAAVKPSADPG